MKTGNLDIYRSGSIIATVKIDESTEFNGQINGVNKISVKFRSTSYIDIHLLDYIMYDGNRYQLNEFVDMTINAFYNYTVNFESNQYDIARYVFKDINGSFSFSFFGDATQQLQKVVDLINTYESGWTVGFVETTIAKTIDYLGNSARSALTLICDAYNFEFIVDGKEISLRKIIKNDVGAIVLQYGKGNGLTELNRKLTGDFFTRLYVEGSSRNIPADYRGGRETLVFDTVNNYVDKGVVEYGVFEKAIVFEDIYPHRTGTLTSVTGLFTLGDTSIDFNLADNFITGQIPKIVMQTGDLAGEEFEIVTTSYDNTAKTFDIKVNYEGAYEYPNSTVNIKTGDTYVFIGINLPQSYIDVAEAELYNAAVDYINANGSVIDMAFALNVDEKFVRENGLENLLRLGNKVNIINAPAAINVDLRIVNINFPILVPSRIKATISDKIPLSSVGEIEKLVVGNSRDIVVAQNKEVKNKKYSDLRLLEFQSKIFDPSGDYFDPINIKPLSIETISLAVGTRPQTFALTTVLRPNYNGVEYQFGWDAGQLIHYTIEPGTTYTWNIASGFIGSLVAATSYYIYARCNKSNDTAVIVLDTAKRLVDSDSTYYYFLVGTLSSRLANAAGTGFYRWITLSYGTTEINGSFLRTGVITSQNGNTTLDLDTGIFRGKLEFLNADESAYIPLTDLKSLAFEDLVEVAKLGSTVIEGGYINTVLLDADVIRAAIIKTDYIEGLELNFVQGTIGGNEITSTGIVGAKFDITNGVITAEDANISGTFIAGDTSNGIIMDSSDLSLKFLNGGDIIHSITPGSGFYSNNKFRSQGTGGNYSEIGINGIRTNGFIEVTDLGVPANGMTVTCDFGGGVTLKFSSGVLIARTGF